MNFANKNERKKNIRENKQKKKNQIRRGEDNQA